MIHNNLYTKKQNAILERLLTRDWFMLILHGAVRAGKTMLNNDIFLMELLRVKEQAKLDGVEEPMYILAAVSSSTLESNVLQELRNKYHIDFKFDRHGNFKLFGVKVITTYTRTISGIGSIRGMTSYGAYVNETSLANKEVFDEIIKRCSGEGARIVCDTNPDHPKHWLKEDYIDKADGERILEYNFTIFDNNFLSQRYIDNVINATPGGVFTQRGIYGQWVIGEGAIYSDFNHEKHILSHDQVPWDSIERYICGVDWGYEHHGVISVIGIDSKQTHYLIKEFAYQHKHIDEWIDIGKEIASQYGKNTPFYCDSARPEYVDAFYYAGLNAMNAFKAVLPGISEVASLIKNSRFFVLEDSKKFIQEVNQYSWNAIGDVPIKKNDDAMDAVRYAVYSELMIRQDGFI